MPRLDRVPTAQHDIRPGCNSRHSSTLNVPSTAILSDGRVPGLVVSYVLSTKHLVHLLRGQRSDRWNSRSTELFYIAVQESGDGATGLVLHLETQMEANLEMTCMTRNLFRRNAAHRGKNIRRVLTIRLETKHLAGSQSPQLDPSTAQ